MDTTAATLPEGVAPLASYPPAAPIARAPTRPRAALIVIDLFALLGVLFTGVALFAQGWVHAVIVFPMPGRAADFVARTFGLNVDRELARIANEQVSKVLPPTLWQYAGQAFHWAFALLVLVAVLLLLALFVARIRVIAQVLALLGAAGAMGLIVTTLVGMAQKSDSLPTQVAQAAARSTVVNRAFAVTTGKPELVVTVGWPLYAGAVGLLLVMVGVVLGVIFATLRHGK
jgi:hypothetical protein